MRTLRLSSSGEPTDVLTYRTPLDIPAVCGFIHADTLYREGANVTAWPNLRSMVPWTVPPSVTIAPTVDVVDGKQVVRFHGDGLTPNVGSWMQTTEPAWLLPTRYTSSQATFHAAISVKMELSGVNAQNTLLSFSDNAVLLNYLGFFGNIQAAGDRLVHWSGANGGIGALLATSQTQSAEWMLFEVHAQLLSPPLNNPGVYQRLYVNGQERAANLPAATMSSFAPFNVATLGAVERSAGFDNPANTVIRCSSLAYNPTSQDVQAIRNWMLADMA